MQLVQPKRKIVVLTSLVALLTLASALLLALAPPPLAAEGYDSLSAADRGPFLDEIFRTAVAAKADQWKFIYIHHSATDGGDAAALGAATGGLTDHFIVGNGHGCQDGEIEFSPRWNKQQPAGDPPGVDHIDPTCIGICVVGDFDHSMPTPLQLRRLTQLVTTLQSQFHIAADHVILLSDSNGVSGIGRYFPVTAFRDQILP